MKIVFYFFKFLVRRENYSVMQELENLKNNLGLTNSENDLILRNLDRLRKETTSKDEQVLIIVMN